MADTPAAPASGDISVKQAITQTGQSAPDRIVIHPFPKIVLMWPVMLLSLVFFFLGGGVTDEALVSKSALGVAWVTVFFFNMLVQTFDFGRNNFVATVASLALVFVGLWVWDLQTETEIYGSIFRFFQTYQLDLHPNFYAMMATMFAVLFVLAFATTRFNYWVLSPNQLTHKHGILGDERQYATINMAVEKEIPDVFEFLLFGSGRLIFKPGVGTEANKALVVDNVFRVNHVEANVREFMRFIKVDEDRNR
ncbi:MAG: hypothetical protein IPP14_03355 [Planctomycetes bacterium]|nr:hypothetical protein [Planctomycetota bacterium]